MNLFGVELSGTDSWLLAAVAACLAWLVPHRLTIAREDRSRILSARNAFCAVFAADLSALRHLRVTEPGQVFGILSATYPQDEAAYIEYIRLLSWLNAFLLRRRWVTYRGQYQQAPELPSEDKRYRLAHFIGSSVENEETKRIDAILAITKLITQA